MIKAAFASGTYGEFGLANGLPWGAPLKGDMEQFIAFTEGCVLVMGHNTFTSLPSKLRGLKHVVLTTDKDVQAKNGDRPDAYNLPNEPLASVLVNIKTHVAHGRDICFIGGARILEDVGYICDAVLHTGIRKDGPGLVSELYHDVSVDLSKVFSGRRLYSTEVASGVERGYKFKTTLYT